MPRYRRFSPSWRRLFWLWASAPASVLPPRRARLRWYMPPSSTVSTTAASSWQRCTPASITRLCPWRRSVSSWWPPASSAGWLRWPISPAWSPTRCIQWGPTNMWSSCSSIWSSWWWGCSCPSTPLFWLWPRCWWLWRTCTTWAWCRSALWWRWTWPSACLPRR